jgi:hypothetical protein
MALFTDSTISTLEDLTAQDSSVLDVAATEGIDVTRKMALARDELGMELTTLLTRSSSYDLPLLPGYGPNVGSVVVTAPLQLWHAYRTLELIYRDAFNNQLNDRYSGKRDQYHDLAKWAQEKLTQTGIGIAANPVPQAAIPELAVSSGALAEGTYYVTMAWVNRSGEEGASAVAATIQATEGSGFTVLPGNVPANVGGWNVFVGTSPEKMTQQNETLVDAGQSWIQSTAPRADGRAPGAGQAPSYLKPAPRILQRG